MPAQYYKDALRLGVKERRNCVTHGQYPYLSVLDNFVSLEKSSNGIDLGVQQVPAHYKAAYVLRDHGGCASVHEGLHCG